MSLVLKNYKARESRQVRCKSWQISFWIPRSGLRYNARSVSDAEHVGELLNSVGWRYYALLFQTKAVSAASSQIWAHRSF